ncbi:MAG: hypothetical protein U0169_15545 [Polyangiaceae bacterium]
MRRTTSPCSASTRCNTARRGSSTATPDTLFFNFANPAAALGNAFQGAIDQMSLVKFARTVNSPVGAGDIPRIKFKSAIGFWGHSQGATEGGIAMPYATGYVPNTDPTMATAGYNGAVLSGEGASLIDSLLTKTNPVNIAAVVPFVIGDTQVDRYHPVLSVLQAVIDPSDPVNHAVRIATTPITSGSPKHVFQPFGVGDTYATNDTQLTFAYAGGLAQTVLPPGMTDDQSYPKPTADNPRRRARRSRPRATSRTRAAPARRAGSPPTTVEYALRIRRSLRRVRHRPRRPTSTSSSPTWSVVEPRLEGGNTVTSVA